VGRIADEFEKARQVYRTEGLVSLLRRGLRFLVYCVFEYRSYWLYAERPGDIQELNESDFMPKIADFTPKVVSSNAEADELEAKGFEFRSQIPHAREILDSGAVGLCIFVGRELANMGWLVTSQRAMDIVGEPPCRVDFADNEVVGTGAWTNPKYRHLRLRAYSRFMSLQASRERGAEVKRGVIAKRNVAAMKSRASVNPPRGEGRYLRVLWWKSWKERPLSREQQEPTR
jgi:hypothetical protein